jgi:hypothetical protein
MLAFTKTCIDNNTNSGLDYVFLMCVNQDYGNYSWFILEWLKPQDLCDPIRPFACCVFLA